VSFSQLFKKRLDSPQNCSKLLGKHCQCCACYLLLLLLLLLLLHCFPFVHDEHKICKHKSQTSKSVLKLSFQSRRCWPKTGTKGVGLLSTSSASCSLARQLAGRLIATRAALSSGQLVGAKEATRRLPAGPKVAISFAQLGPPFKKESNSENSHSCLSAPFPPPVPRQTDELPLFSCGNNLRHTLLTATDCKLDKGAHIVCQAVRWPAREIYKCFYFAFYLPGLLCAQENAQIGLKECKFNINLFVCVCSPMKTRPNQFTKTTRLRPAQTLARAVRWAICIPSE